MVTWGGRYDQPWAQHLATWPPCHLATWPPGHLASPGSQAPGHLATWPPGHQPWLPGTWPSPDQRRLGTSSLPSTCESQLGRDDTVIAEIDRRLMTCRGGSGGRCRGRCRGS